MDNEISVLIIEDEALIAQSIKMQLESFGYTIAAVCYKYETALEYIETQKFDLVVTDINLGNGIDEKSGITIATAVKRIKNCPIIFLTAFSDKETIKKASALLPSAYLVKPVNAANLFAAVQLALENFTAKTNEPIETHEAKEYFFIKQGSQLLKLYWHDVLALEATKNYAKTKTKQYPNGVLIRGSLKQILEKVMPEKFRAPFIKINRSEAIHKSIILSIKKDTVVTTLGDFELSSDININNLMENI